MTAKHRKPKNNLKNEDNFLKNEVVETEARAGGSNYAVLLALFLMIVAVGAAGAWLCLQQHQTLTHLTDNITAMQMKIVRLQSSHEEMRQSGDKHTSESVGNRLIALEESFALVQKQVDMALATAEQLKTMDLPAQVLSLHTEMKTRMAEMQQATVSLEQLQTGKSEEFEDVRLQVEGLTSLSAELSQTVEVLIGSLGAAESMLEEKQGQLTALGTALIEQAAELLKLNLKVDAQQAQLKASTQEVATVRELLENEQSQQASVEEQLSAVHESLQEQNSAAQSVHSELRAQLENIQLALEAQTAAEPVEEVIEEKEEEEAAATEEVPVEQEVPVAPAEEEVMEEVMEEVKEEEVETTQTEEESQEISEGEEVLEESSVSNPEEEAEKAAPLLEEADEEEEPLEQDE